ncbi:MAG: ABC transporter ATP-binding protein [Clostridiales bacterium]|jgi:iron complex transport system ATP-binding protein|nr:ABC transporter ATP-binding protein [Clostridiales bacterium]
MMLSVDRLSFSFGQRPVLRDISFSIPHGQMVSLLGPNGTGKSTLFRCILGLLTGYSGSVLVDGKNTARIRLSDMARLIAYIPQVHYPAFNFTVLDMVLMGTSSRFSALYMPGEREKEKALLSLEMMGIQDLALRNYMMISGGEQQLVLMARALSQDSRLLIMDEPTASLDFGNQTRVMQCVRSLTSKGYTILQATHNPNQAIMFSDQIMAMSGGRIIAQGEPGDVMNAALIEEIYGIRVRVECMDDGKTRYCVPVFE